MDLKRLDDPIWLLPLIPVEPLVGALLQPGAADQEKKISSGILISLVPRLGIVKTAAIFQRQTCGYGWFLCAIFSRAFLTFWRSSTISKGLAMKSNAPKSIALAANCCEFTPVSMITSQVG